MNGSLKNEKSDTNPKKPQWKKNLYEKSNYPDNYTDETFLNELKTNLNIKNFGYLEAINASLFLLQEICSTILIAIVFFHMYKKNIKASDALIGTSVLTLVGYAIFELYYCKAVATFSIVSDKLVTVFISLFFGYIFSPLLYTLTVTISSDSIFKATTLLMIVHLIFFDYGASVAIVSSTLSTCASIFGSICLASRLETDFDAFVLLAISITVFVLFPIFRKKSPQQWFITLSLFCTTQYCLWLISQKISLIFTFLIAFTNLFCPIFYCKCQKYKENVYGPWDQAVVSETNFSFQ